ncbi:MmpS family transport accessory protein, partial [Mycolicibacter minnesotensis]
MKRAWIPMVVVLVAALAGFAGFRIHAVMG